MDIEDFYKTNLSDSKGRRHGLWKHKIYGMIVFINYNHGVSYGKFETFYDNFYDKKLKNVGYCFDFQEGEKLEYVY